MRLMDWKICTRQGDGINELMFLSIGVGCGFFDTDRQDGQDWGFSAWMEGMDGDFGFRMGSEMMIGGRKNE